MSHHELVPWVIILSLLLSSQDYEDIINIECKFKFEGYTDDLTHMYCDMVTTIRLMPPTPHLITFLKNDENI